MTISAVNNYDLPCLFVCLINEYTSLSFPPQHTLKLARKWHHGCLVHSCSNVMTLFLGLFRPKHIAQCCSFPNLFSKLDFDFEQVHLEEIFLDPKLFRLLKVSNMTSYILELKVEEEEEEDTIKNRISR